MENKFSNHQMEHRDWDRILEEVRSIVMPATWIYWRNLGITSTTGSKTATNPKWTWKNTKKKSTKPRTQPMQLPIKFIRWQRISHFLWIIIRVIVRRGRLCLIKEANWRMDLRIIWVLTRAHYLIKDKIHTNFKMISPN